MATVRKGILTKAGEWWQHLRKTKRIFWKKERKAAQRDMRQQMKDDTDDGMKKSAKGLLRVEQDDFGNFVLHDQQSRYGETRGLLRPVFRDSKVLSHETLVGIRERLETGNLQ